MASAAQIEAFAWWLKQTPDKRRGKDIQARFGVSTDTAKLWLAEFNSKLASTAKRAVAIQLKARVQEYAETSEIAATSGVTLAQAYEVKIRRIAENPAKADTSELNALASGLKTVYQLVESASGADLAKKRALMPGASGSGLPSLPELGEIPGYVDTESETIEDETSVES